jgi:hypothetical protein
VSLLSKEELNDALLVLETQSGFGVKVRAHIAGLEADNAALFKRATHEPRCNAYDGLECSCVLAEPHPGAALLERMKRLEAVARTGLASYHGHACRLAGKIRPENPAECEDPHCREWAKALEGA